jgi:hypothetical protein
MTNHKATPEQWAMLEEQSAPEYDNTILELRARVEALEAARRPAAKVYEINEPLQLTPEQAQHVRDLLAPNSKPTPNPSQIRSSPDHFGQVNKMVGGSLVERVQRAIHDVEFPHGNDEARAAIREVAAWLKSESEGHLGSGLHWSRRLEQEADRG